MGDLFERPPAAQQERAVQRKTKKANGDSYLQGLSPDVADAIREGGGRWWIKPGVWQAMAEAGATRDDWREVSQLAQKADPKWYPTGAIIRAQDMVPRKKPGGITGVLNDAVKAPVRIAASVAESGWQELQGGFRTVTSGLLDVPEVLERTGASNDRSLLTRRGDDPASRARSTIVGEGYVGSQSTFGITLGKLFDGEISVGDILSGSEKALGGGFLPGGDVRVEQAERAWRSARIGNLSLTPGRLAATTVTEPGTLPFNVMSGFIDAGLIVVGDPINPVLAKAGAAIKARRYFDPEASIGLLRGGSRPTVTGLVQDFLNSEKSTRFKNFLVDTDDPVKILQASNWNLPVADAVRLADTADPTEVRSILDEVLGFGMTHRPKGWHYTDAGVAIRTKKSEIRWLNNMPKAGVIDRTNPEEFTRQIHDWLVNAKVAPDRVQELTERAMRSSFAVRNGAVVAGMKAGDQYDVLTTASDAVNEALQASGVGKRASRDLTQHWQSFEALRAYNIDALTGVERPLPNLIVNGREFPAPTPQMLEQFLGRYIPFPDVQTLREIRTRTGAVGTVFSAGGRVQAPLDAEIAVMRGLDTFYKTWKPFQILRGAYIGRVVGDEQARMASAGQSSMFSHPFSYMALAMSDDGRIGKLLDSLPGVTTGRYGTDVGGQSFRDMADDTDFAGTLYASVTDLMGQQGKRRVPGAHVPLRLHTEAGVPESGAVDAWADNLRLLNDNQWTRKLAQGVPLPEVQDEFWKSSYRAAVIGSGNKAELSDLAQQVSTRAGADEYVKTTLATWVADVTQGDARLVEIVATGKSPVGRLHKNMQVTKEGRKYLDSLVEEGVGPQRVLGAPTISLGGRKAEAYDQTLNFLFDWIAVRPSNWASRSPSFRQEYWTRVEQILPEASDDARAAILDVAAVEAKLPKKVVDRLRSLPSTGRGLELDDINLLANRYAADATKKLLYDLSNRGQAWDALRVIFPFGEAYKEVMTTWLRLLTESPKSLRTLQRGIEGARGAGYFYTDPSTGQETFSFPGSGLLLEHLPRLDGDFRGSVSGLSIAGSLAPGFGPTIQWAAGQFLPDKPEFNGIRDAIFQFGGEGEGIVDVLTPAWADKLLRWDDSSESDRTFNNSVGEVINHLASTGRYDLQDRDDLVQLQDDAIEKAQDLYVLRGILQFFAPTAPRPSLDVKTKTGSLVTAELMEQFRALQDEDYTTAYARFITKFGERGLAAIVPRSKSNVAGLSSSGSFADFEKTHKKIFKKYPEVAGLFAPEDTGSDLTEYDRQFRTNQRSTIPQKDRLEQVNTILGRMAYDAQKARIGDRPNRAQQQWLSKVRRQIMEEFPGYNPFDFNPGEAVGRVQDLERAAKEPSLEENPGARGTREYFAQRARVIEAYGSPSGWQTAGRARGLRDWLRGVAQKISETEPEFVRVWDQLLSRELADDDQAVEE